MNTSYPCVGWWISMIWFILHCRDIKIHSMSTSQSDVSSKERFGEMVQDQRKPWPLFVAWWQFWAGIGPIPKARNLSPYFIWMKFILWIDRFFWIEYVALQIVTSLSPIQHSQDKACVNIRGPICHLSWLIGIPLVDDCNMKLTYISYNLSSNTGFKHCLHI